MVAISIIASTSSELLKKGKRLERIVSRITPEDHMSISMRGVSEGLWRGEERVTGRLVGAFEEDFGGSESSCSCPVGPSGWPRVVLGVAL